MTRTIAIVVIAAATLACAPARVAPVPTATTAGSELPDGPGKTILQTSCTSCHSLREVTKFGGYYTRAQWHDIVVTMVQYGAEVDEKEVEVLADYLAAHLGKK